MENRAFVIVEGKKIPEIVFQKAAKYEMQSKEAPSNSHDYEWYLGKSRGVMEGAAYIFDLDPMVVHDMIAAVADDMEYSDPDATSTIRRLNDAAWIVFQMSQGIKE